MQVSLLLQLIEWANQAIGIILLTGLIAFVLYRNIRVAMAGKEFKHTQKKRDLKNVGGDKQITWFALISRTIYLWVSLVIPQILAIGIIWLVPLYLANLLNPEITRWAMLCVVAILVVYFSTNRYGGYRGLISVIGHLTILLIGWSLGKWLGIILISLPTLAAYYYLLYRLAEVIIPASDPDNSREKAERFKILVWYMWGIQYPIIVVPNHANAVAETRINGSVFQNSALAPGYIWTNAYQVVGLTAGTDISRVEGPGAIYTRRFERVRGVVDLRTHIQIKEIEAITRYGIPIRVTLFASFCIDRLPFDNTIRSRLRHAGSYPYSRPRVQAALSLGGVSGLPPDSGNPALRWDDRVMSQIEGAARQVIAGTSLEELWLPGKDAAESGALDLVNAKIRDNVIDFLRENGIRLYSVSIVNYFLHLDSSSDRLDEITLQQLTLWISRWAKFSKQKLREVPPGLEKKQLDVVVLAILKSFAESLKNIMPVKVDFPSDLIPMVFLARLYPFEEQNMRKSTLKTAISSTS